MEDAKPVRGRKGTAAPRVIDHQFAYVKYISPCTSNAGEKHPEKEIVSIARFLKVDPRRLEVKTKSYRIQCGEEDNFCRATIALLGESIEEIENITESKRMTFLHSRNVQTATEASSAPEERANKRKQSSTSITAQNNLITLAAKKIHSLNSNDVVKKKTTSTPERWRTSNATNLPVISTDSDSASKRNTKDSGVSSLSDGSREKSITRVAPNTTKKPKETNKIRNPKNVVSRPKSVNVGKHTTATQQELYGSQSSDNFTDDSGWSALQSGNDSSGSARLRTKQVGSKSVTNPKGKSTPGRNSEDGNILSRHLKKRAFSDSRSMGGGTDETVQDNAQSSDDNLDDNLQTHSRSLKTASTKSVPVTKKLKLSSGYSHERSTAGTKSSKIQNKNTVKDVHGVGPSNSDGRTRSSTRSAGKSSTLESLHVRNRDITGPSQESESSTKQDIGVIDSLQPASECSGSSRDGSPVRSSSPDVSDVDDNLHGGPYMTYKSPSAERFNEEFRADFNEITRIWNEGEAEEPVDKLVDRSSAMEIAAVIRRLRLENRVFRTLNIELQKDSLVNSQKVSATIEKLDLESRQTMKERIVTGQDLKVGTVDEAKGLIHAGYGKWINFVEYVRYCDDEGIKKTTPSAFMANMARLIFTDKVLINSSVTGTRSNAYKDKPIKPMLEKKGVDAVAAITRYWMKSKNKTEGEIIKEISTLSHVISKKISDLNRTSKSAMGNMKDKKASAAAERSKKQVDGNDVEEQMDVDEPEKVESDESDADSSASDSNAEVVPEASENSCTDVENESLGRIQPDTPPKNAKEKQTSKESEDDTSDQDKSADKKTSSTDISGNPLAPLPNDNENVPESIEKTEMVLNGNGDDAFDQGEGNEENL